MIYDFCSPSASYKLQVTFAFGKLQVVILSFHFQFSIALYCLAPNIELPTLTIVLPSSTAIL